MSRWVRSWTAAAAAVLALAAVPAAIVTMPSPGLARADVCGNVGGRHVSVGGCTDPGAYVAPPPEDAPPDQDAPPPPPPDVNACASVGGRHVSVGGCT